MVNSELKVSNSTSSMTLTGFEGLTVGDLGLEPQGLLESPFLGREPLLAETLRVNSPASVQKDYPALEAGFTPRLRDVGPLTLRLILVDDNTIGSFDDGTGTSIPGTTFDGCDLDLTGAERPGEAASAS